MQPLRSLNNLAQQNLTEPHFCHFSPDGQFLAISVDDKIKIFDVFSGNSAYSIKMTAGTVRKFEWRSDGSLIINSVLPHNSIFTEIWRFDSVALNPEQYLLIETLKRAGTPTILTNNSWAQTIFESLNRAEQESLKKDYGVCFIDTLPATGLSPEARSLSFNNIPLLRPIGYTGTFTRQMLRRPRELSLLAAFSAAAVASTFGAVLSYKLARWSNAQYQRVKNS